MLQILIVLWVLAYITPIFKFLSAYIRSGTAIYKLVDFCAVYGNSVSYFRPKEETYRKELTALLRYYPVITEFSSYPKLSYNQSDETIYQNSRKLIPNIQMQRNFLRCKLISSLNPLLSIKEIILLPLSLLREMGFHPGRAVSFLLTSTTWLLSYLLEMFQPEIKVLLIALFKQLIAA